MSDDREPRPLWINSERFWDLSSETEEEFSCLLALDIIMALYKPTMTPVNFDPDTTCAELLRRLPGRGHTPDRLRASRADLLKFFFIELADGRWVPSPDVFVVNDPEPGAQA